MRSVAPALLVAFAAGPLAAWTPATQLSIAEHAADLAPFDLARQIDKHPRAFRTGVLEPFESAPPTAHYWHADGSGDLDHAAFRAVADTIDAIRSHRPFAEIVHRLGAVSHYVADANNPLNASGADPAESRYFADYLRYAESAEPRFALVFYAGEPAVEDDESMRLALYRALYRGRKLYPYVGAEYRRIGFEPGIGHFDDRSTAFGVAAVSFSHALTDAARVFRYIWVAAGGAADRSPHWTADEILVIREGRRGR